MRANSPLIDEARSLSTRLVQYIQLERFDEFEHDRNFNWLVKSLSGTKGNLNRRYEGIYLAAHIGKAREYASASCGSELISTAVELWMRLFDQEALVPDDLQISTTFATLLDQPYHPVVLKITNLKISHLKAESGDEPYANIESLWRCNQCKSEIEIDFNLQRSNFEYTELIEPDLIEIVFGDSQEHTQTIREHIREQFTKS